MNIQTSQPPSMGQIAAAPGGRPAGVKNKRIPEGATVKHDAEKDCFEYSAPGHHYSVCRHNPLLEGAKFGGLVAVPAFVGAFGHELLGLAEGGVARAAVGVVGGTVAIAGVGAAVGAAVLGYKGYKGSNNNPFYGVLAGLGGIAVGGAASALFSQPGLWGGLTGAVVATGAATIGAATLMAVQNHNATHDAKAHGWQP